jgi:CheY-like chemotaxis protein
MDMSGREILVVEDVRFTRTTIVRMLNQMGISNIHEAEDGKVGLALLKQYGATVDCVLTDLEMPNMNGLELLKAVRVGTGSIPRQLRMVALTGNSEMHWMGTALLLDVDAILTKPTSKTTLETCLDRLFGSDTNFVDAGPEIYRGVDLTPQATAPATESTEFFGNEVQVDVSALQPNSRLSRDLLFQNGRLLLRAGTVLGERMIGRLHELVSIAGLRDKVWIVDNH